MRTSETLGEIAQALMKFQVNCPPLRKDSLANKDKFKYKYTSVDDLIKTIRQPLADQGLSFFQSVVTEGERVGVITLLMHISGEFIESDALFLASKTDRDPNTGEVRYAKMTAPDAGGAITSAKRYALTAALGLASDDEAAGQDQQHDYHDRGRSAPPAGRQQAPPARNAQQERQAPRQPSSALYVLTDASITKDQAQKLTALVKQIAEQHGQELTDAYKIAAAACKVPGKDAKQLNQQEAANLIQYLTNRLNRSNAKTQ